MKDLAMRLSKVAKVVESLEHPYGMFEKVTLSVNHINSRFKEIVKYNEGGESLQVMMDLKLMVAEAKVLIKRVETLYNDINKEERKYNPKGAQPPLAASTKKFKADSATWKARLAWAIEHDDGDSAYVCARELVRSNKLGYS